MMKKQLSSIRTFAAFLLAAALFLGISTSAPRMAFAAEVDETAAGIQESIETVYSGELFDEDEEFSRYAYFAVGETVAVLVLANEGMDEFEIYIGEYEDDGEGTLEITDAISGETIAVYYEETDDGIYLEIIDLEIYGDLEAEDDLAALAEILEQAAYGKPSKPAKLAELEADAQYVLAGEMYDEDDEFSCYVFFAVGDELAAIVMADEEMTEFTVYAGSYEDDDEGLMTITDSDTGETIDIIYEFTETGANVEIPDMGISSELEDDEDLGVFAILQTLGWGQDEYDEMRADITSVFAGEVEDEDGATGFVYFTMTDKGMAILVYVNEDDEYTVVMGKATDDDEGTIEIEDIYSESTIVVYYEMLDDGMYIEVEDLGGIFGELEEADTEDIIEALKLAEAAQ